MNINKLLDAEKKFYSMYPEGFQNEEMIKVGKKHKLPQMVELTKQSFTKDKFDDVDEVFDSIIKVIGKSSMVSVFEKVKFRDFAKVADNEIKTDLVNALNEILHGDEEYGFGAFVKTLEPFKLDKWPLITIIPSYFKPTEEVFVKPTVVKGVLKELEVDSIKYKPKPTYDFYNSYRTIFNNLKTKINPQLSTSNAEFSGFLMIGLL